MSLSQRIEQYMYLVRYVLKRFYSGGATVARFHNMEVQDLNQVGMIGLIKADCDYDDTKPITFFTYAIHKIRGEIRRYLRDHNHSVRFPRTIKEIARSLPDTSSLSIDSIIEQTGASRLDALGVLDYINRVPLSLNQVAWYEGDTGREVTFQDVIPAKESTEDEALRHLELSERLSILNPKTRRICELVLAGFDQEAAAKQIGISQSRVSRHLSNAVKTIEKEYNTR